ncbi:hypothetical protein Tco_0418419 [Tanacetum coccineum]
MSQFIGSCEERLSNEEVKWVERRISMISVDLPDDEGGSYHMTHKRDFLYDFKGFDGGSVQLGDNRTCTINRTRKVKIQLHDGSSFILEYVTYVLGLRSSLISLGTLEKEGYTVKMQMGRINVSNNDAAVAQRRLQEKQLEEKTNTDCLVKEHKKVHLGIKVGANIMVTGVPGQEGAEGNVAEMKKLTRISSVQVINDEGKE